MAAEPTMATPRFVGRVAERARLAAALADPPALVLLEGGPGIGKSRLLHEALAAGTSPGRVLLAGCPPFREPATLGPLAEAVRPAAALLRERALSPLCGALRPLLPEWGDWLPPTLEPAESAAAARDRTFRALAEVLDACDVSVLAVEDAHWADDSTLHFLLFALARPDGRLSVVVTARPGEVDDGSTLRLLTTRGPAGRTPVRIELGPLDERETGGLAASMLGPGGIDARFAHLLQEHSDGLPLAVEESVRLLAARGQLVRGRAGWRHEGDETLEVPPTLRDSVLERLTRVEAPARKVLRAAAVLADPTHETLLLDVSTLEGDVRLAGLSEALASGLLAQDEGRVVSFRHALAARAVYDDLLESERRTLHAAAGRVLEAAGAAQPARLAGHFRAAGDAASWTRAAEQAADLALASGDQVTAFSLIRDLMLHAHVTPAALAVLASKLPFTAFTGSKHFDELVAVLRTRLADASLSRGEAAEIRLQLARVYLQMESFTLGREALVAAAPDLTHRPAEAARAMLFLSLPQGLVDWPAGVHLDWLRRAEELIEAHDLNLPGRLPFGLTSRITTLLTLGEPRGWVEAQRVPDDTDVAQDRPIVAIGQLNLGDLAMRWGRYDEARERLARAVDLADRYGTQRIGDSAIAAGVHLDWFTGAWSGLAERVSALADDEALQPITRAEIVLVGGMLAAARGDPTRAAAAYREAIDTVIGGGGREYLMEPAAALARLRLAEGRPGDAVEVTEQAMDAVRALGVWLWATDLALPRVDALLLVDREDEAGALVTEFEKGIRGGEAATSLAALPACQAAVALSGGRPESAAELFASSSTCWSRMGRPYEALLMSERAADAMLAGGTRKPAVLALSESAAGLSRLGAAADAARVGRRLTALGVDPPIVRRPGRPSSGDVLTPREVDTVRLLAEGRTNREIADALVLSPRTVASHLSSAMQKMGVRSRTGLALKAVELGLIEDESGG